MQTKLEDVRPGYYWAKWEDNDGWFIVKVIGPYPFQAVSVAIFNGDSSTLHYAHHVESFTFGPRIEPPDVVK